MQPMLLSINTYILIVLKVHRSRNGLKETPLIKKNMNKIPYYFIVSLSCHNECISCLLMVHRDMPNGLVV